MTTDEVVARDEQRALTVTFRLLFEAAQRFSPDPSTRNAALLQPSKRFVVPGIPLSLVSANQFPEGVAASPERLADRDTKLDYMDHAETGAIYMAARRGIATEGATLFCLWAPCCPCARAMVRSGISTLVTYGPLMDKTMGRWQAQVTRGLEILEEAGVDVRRFCGPIGGDLPHLFDGQVWYPR